MLQGPGENAGAVDIGDGLAAVFKIESHNHPSFVEPFQGAATGVGGILRDVFTMGARPVAIMDSLRFGSLDHPRTPYLTRGVVAGIGHYGNCIGVAERRRRRRRSTPATTQHPGERVHARHRAGGPHLPRQGRRAGQPGHLRRLADRTRRHPRREPARVRGARRARRGEAPGRAGGRPVHGEAAPGGVSRAHADRARGGDPGHGRGGAHVELGRDGGAGRGRRRDRPRPGAAARRGHGPVRDPALRVAGADAAGREAGQRGRGPRHLRAMGPPGGGDRPAHRRRRVARALARRRRVRHPGRRS